jgi:hypothetical protein
MGRKSAVSWRRETTPPPIELTDKKGNADECPKAMSGEF